jgi:hypothetical protein
MGVFAEKWKDAKTVFERTTNTKKPNPSFAKIRVGTSVAGALKAVDTALENFEKAPAKTQKLADAVAKAATTYTASKNKYLVTLDQAANNEPDKVNKAAYQKGIALLKRELKALDAEITLRVGYTKTALQQGSVQDGLAANIWQSIDASSRRASAFIAKLKAEPSAAYFNGNIKNIARDINQGIGNIDKLKGKGYQIRGQTPAYLFEALREWASDTRKVAATATQQEILREVDELETAVKEVRVWYKANHE